MKYYSCLYQNMMARWKNVNRNVLRQCDRAVKFPRLFSSSVYFSKLNSSSVHDVSAYIFIIQEYYTFEEIFNLCIIFLPVWSEVIFLKNVVVSSCSVLLVTDLIFSVVGSILFKCLKGGIILPWINLSENDLNVSVNNTFSYNLYL